MRHRIAEIEKRRLPQEDPERDRRVGLLVQELVAECRNTVPGAGVGIDVDLEGDALHCWAGFLVMIGEVAIVVGGKSGQYQRGGHLPAFADEQVVSTAGSIHTHDLQSLFRFNQRL